MNKTEFKTLRKHLGKTQRQMSQLLGTSLKAIHSYEQGWRTVPPAVERQIYFLLYLKNDSQQNGAACWDQKDCPPEKREQCPAWEFNAGQLCWFINGTICDGKSHKTWRDKMKICRSCEVFSALD
jgi:transcriptional regulator with XRE-family HTH domain